VNIHDEGLLPAIDVVEMEIGEEIPFPGKFLAGDRRVNENPALTVMHTSIILFQLAN